MKLKSLGKGVSVSDKGIYYINYKDETGVSRRRKVVAKTVTEARRELMRIKGDVSDIRDGRIKPTKAVTNTTVEKLDELANRYFELAKGYDSSADTNEVLVRQSVARYENWIKGRVELPISSIEVLEYQKWLSSQLVEKRRSDGTVSRVVIATATVNLIMSLLKAIVNWGVRHKLIEGGEYLSFKRLDMDNERERVLSKDDVARLFERLEMDRVAGSRQTGYGDTQLRNMVVVGLGLFTGSRPASYIELRRRDVTFGEDGLPEFISYSAKKGGDAYNVPVHSRLKRVLGLWMMKCVGESEDSRLFSVSYNSIKRSLTPLLDELFNDGIDVYDVRNRVSLYTLRHTYATNVLKASGNIYAVSKLMGHRSIETTKRYAKISDEDTAKLVQSVEF